MFSDFIGSREYLVEGADRDADGTSRACRLALDQLVIVATYSLRAEVVRVESSADLPVFEGTRSRGRDLIKQYIALTKPRVISLLLFTTLATCSLPHAVGRRLAVPCRGDRRLLGGGGANAINMVIDRDIDGTMKRTAKRPTVTQTSLLPTRSRSDL